MRGKNGEKKVGKKLGKKKRERDEVKEMRKSNQEKK